MAWAYEFALFCQRAFEVFASGRAGEHFIHQFLDGGHQRQLPGHTALQQKSGDDQAIDFVGAFEDSVDAGVAVGALGGIFFHKSVATVDLDSFVDDEVDHLGAPDFDDGAFDGILFDSFANFFGGVCAGFVDLVQRDVHHADRAVDHSFAGVDAHCHVGEFFANQAEVGDDFIESLALLGVANGVFERDARAADAHGSQLEAADVQNVEGDYVAFADFTEHVFCGHFAVVEDDRAGGGAADAHLVFFGADGESRESFLDQECSELFAINFGEDGEQIGEAGVGDPHFFAVEDVVSCHP